MPGIAGIHSAIIDEIVTQLKTITELADDPAPNGPRVFKWNDARNPTDGRYEVEVKAAQMTVTQHSVRGTDNNFQVFCDLRYYPINTDSFEDAFDNALAVAEKIYDKLHLTTINGTCRNALVQYFPVDGELSGRNLRSVPIRIEVNCQRVVSQL